jgi:hypothetical protein
VGYPVGEIALDDGEEGFLKGNLQGAFHCKGEGGRQVFVGFQKSFTQDSERRSYPAKYKLFYGV